MGNDITKHRQRHFNWMVEAASLLVTKLNALMSAIVGAKPDEVLVATEGIEDEVNCLILQLIPQQLGFYGPYLPIRRSYLTADFRPAVMLDLPDDPAEQPELLYTCNWPNADIARVLIANPEEFVARFETTANWAHHGVPSRNWSELDEETRSLLLHQWEAKQGLISPSEGVSPKVMIEVVQSWIGFVNASSSHFLPPPEWNPECVATQLRELSHDIECYRYELLKTEDVIARFSGNHDSHDLKGKDARLWDSCATVLAAWHRRLHAQICEAFEVASQLAPDLTYSCQAETGPWVTRTRKLLESLRREIGRRLDSPFNAVNPRAACGFAPMHLDGSYHKQFRSWWAPLDNELHLVADHLAAAVKPPSRESESVSNSNLEKVNTKQGSTPDIAEIDPTCEGDWIGPASKDAVARILTGSPKARGRQIKHIWGSSAQVWKVTGGYAFKIDFGVTLSQVERNALLAEFPKYKRPVDKQAKIGP